MTRTYSHKHRKDMYPQLSSNIWLVRLNGWVFVYELSDCGFEFIWSDLNFRFGGCFEQGLPWHSNNYRVWIHSVMPTWHDQNIQSNAMYREVLTTQLNYLASSAKWLSAGLRTKWFWVRVQLESSTLCSYIILSNLWITFNNLKEYTNKFSFFIHSFEK